MNYAVAEVMPTGGGDFYCRKVFYPSWNFIKKYVKGDHIDDVLSMHDIKNDI